MSYSFDDEDILESKDVKAPRWAALDDAVMAQRSMTKEISEDEFIDYTEEASLFEEPDDPVRVDIIPCANEPVSIAKSACESLKDAARLIASSHGYLVSLASGIEVALEVLSVAIRSDMERLDKLLEDARKARRREE